MTTPQDLKRLAELLGKRDVTINKGFVHFQDSYYYNIHFNPEDDKAQAFEVLEWVLNRIDTFVHDAPGHHPCNRWGAVFGLPNAPVKGVDCDSLEELAVLMALKLIEDN